MNEKLLSMAKKAGGMTLQQQILDEMKRRKVTAQAPITAYQFWVKFDDGKPELNKLSDIDLEFDKMVNCRPPLVSRRLHTKNGITQMVYWPTGMTAEQLFKLRQNKKVFDNGDFKVAYSSNGTLLLFGLQYGLIELNHEQVEMLCEFMNTSVNI